MFSRSFFTSWNDWIARK